MPAQVIAFTELDFFGDGDHAGKYETSLHMALGGNARLDEVDESQRGQLGQWEGQTPLNASSEFGIQCLERILEHFSHIVQPAATSL